MAGFEIDLGSILEKYHGLAKVKVERIIKRDLTVVTSQTYAEVVSQIEEILKRADLAARITAGTIYQPEGEDKKHMTMQEAAEIARKAQPKEMWLTHYSPSVIKPEQYTDAIREIFSRSVISKDRRTTELKFED